MKKLIILFLIFQSLLLFSQKHDYNWQIGYCTYSSANIYPLKGFYFNFNQGRFIIGKNERPINLGSNNATISDANGNLLFYTNGCKIINKNNQIMDNGENLAPGPAHDFACQRSTTLSYGGQTSLILPPVDNDSMYYYFRMHEDFLPPDERVGIRGLTQTTVNMRANNGLGRVVEKDRYIISDSLDFITNLAVRHANGRDWWLFCRKYKTDTCIVLRFGRNGIDTIMQQKIGLPVLRQGDGQIQFTPDGSKLVYYNITDGFQLYDFDRTNGRLSNFRHFAGMPQSLFNLVGGAVSSNSRYWYLFLNDSIVQYDLHATDFINSRINVANYVPLCPPHCRPFETLFTRGVLAPDCKIYLTSGAGVWAMSYIKYPNRRGTACEVVQRGIVFNIEPDGDSVAISRSIPAYVNYRLGSSNAVCDSTIQFRVGVDDVPQRSFDVSDQAVLFPNPVQNLLKVDLPDQLGLEVERVQILNLLGLVLHSEQRHDTYFPMQIPVVSELPEGIYHLLIEFKGNKKLIKRFVKM